MKCMLCGRENPDDALYCGGCGWPQKKQKGGGWKIVAIGAVVIALLAAAAVILFRPAAAKAADTSNERSAAETVASETAASEPAAAEPLTPYELVAKTFVETYWNNDLPTMETVVEYHYYSYLENELDTGRALDCTAETGQSAPCDDARILDLEMALSFMGSYENVKEAYVVTVNYETPERTDSTEVTVGRIGENWVVISYRPFDAD